METNQITEKIKELENWLIENPNSTERTLIESDIKNLKTLLEKNMSRNQIETRIAQLYLALQYCSERNKTFTAGERICINQERFQLMHILENETALARPVSQTIENKLKEVWRLSNLNDFKPYYSNPLKDEILLNY